MTPGQLLGITVKNLALPLKGPNLKDPGGYRKWQNFDQNFDLGTPRAISGTPQVLKIRTLLEAVLWGIKIQTSYWEGQYQN